jgi:hypothetical protein
MSTPRYCISCSILLALSFVAPVNSQTSKVARCLNHCKLSQKVCRHDNSCYGSKKECLQECLTWNFPAPKPGVLPVIGANDIECRTLWLRYAQVTKTQKGACDYSCPGGGLCDSIGGGITTCSFYCDQCNDWSNPCTTDAAGQASTCGPFPCLYPSRQKCTAACEKRYSAFPKGTLICEGYCTTLTGLLNRAPTRAHFDDCLQKCHAFSQAGHMDDWFGNTLQCRLLMLSIVENAPSRCTYTVMCVLAIPSSAIPFKCVLRPFGHPSIH